jgi:hypothetical protein
MVQLTEELVAALDVEAAQQGVSRSEVIRKVLQEFLPTTREAALGNQIADGYRRMPPATPDEWGDVGGIADQAVADLLHRLDAEDRAAGNDPW